jgi:hypothetical protein
MASLMSIAPQGHPGHLREYEVSSAGLTFPPPSSNILQVGNHSLCVTVQGPALNSDCTAAMRTRVTTSILRLIERYYITRFVVYRSTTGALTDLQTWRVRYSDRIIRCRDWIMLTV